MKEHLLHAAWVGTITILAIAGINYTWKCECRIKELERMVADKPADKKSETDD